MLKPLIDSDIIVGIETIKLIALIGDDSLANKAFSYLIPSIGIPSNGNGRDYQFEQLDNIPFSSKAKESFVDYMIAEIEISTDKIRKRYLSSHLENLPCTSTMKTYLIGVMKSGTDEEMAFEREIAWRILISNLTPDDLPDVEQIFHVASSTPYIESEIRYLKAKRLRTTGNRKDARQLRESGYKDFIDNERAILNKSYDAVFVSYGIIVRPIIEEHIIEEFSVAHELDPKDPIALSYLSRAMYKVSCSKYKKELFDYAKASVRIGPKLPETHHALSNAYYCMGQPDDAEKELRKTIDLDPNYYRSLLNLSASEKSKGHIDAADALYERARPLIPENEQYLLKMVPDPKP